MNKKFSESKSCKICECDNECNNQSIIIYIKCHFFCLSFPLRYLHRLTNNTAMFRLRISPIYVGQTQHTNVNKFTEKLQVELNTSMRLPLTRGDVTCFNKFKGLINKFIQICKKFYEIDPMKTKDRLDKNQNDAVQSSEDSPTKIFEL